MAEIVTYVEPGPDLSVLRGRLVAEGHEATAMNAAAAKPMPIVTRSNGAGGGKPITSSGGTMKLNRSV